MHAKQKTEAVPCTPGAFPGGLTRTRFYDGMLLTQEHLEREQTFWRMKRRLTNRALGEGIVWGLRLEWNASRRSFLLSPGYALDCCGNDLVLECPQEIAEHVLVDKHDPWVKDVLSGKTAGDRKCPEPESEQVRKAWITLNYAECAGDPQPIHEDACTSNVTHCEYSSIRESAKLCLAPEPAAPPATPLDVFCERLEALKRECADLAPDCALFETEQLITENTLPLFVEYRNLTTGVPPQQVAPQVGAEPVMTSTSIELPGAGGPQGDRLQISIRPAPGFVFAAGEVRVADGSVTPLPPFGTRFEATSVQFFSADGPAFRISGLRVGPLLVNRPEEEATLALSISQDPEDPSFIVSASDYRNHPAASTCNDALKPGLIFNTEPNCAVRTVALVALCGWFRGLLPNDSKTAAGGEHVAAWWVCYLAWKLLFGANLNDDRGSALSDAFNDLLEQWCAAFMYPGPYCENEHKGVYLGCVELSAKGKIISFDPWASRRYVVTGPLLSYWGGMAGLAPFDVIVGRLAKWICCLGTSQSPAISADAAIDLVDGLPLDARGKALVAGDAETVAAYLDRHNLTVEGSVREVSTIDFASRLADRSFSKLDSLGRDDQLFTGRRVYKLKGTNLHLLEPTRANSGKPFSSERTVVADYAGRAVHSLTPVAREFVVEYLGEVVQAVELNGLDLTEDDAAVKLLVEAVDKYDIVTVDDFLNMGPTRSAELVAAELIENDAFDGKRDVYAAAERLAIAGEALLDRVVTPFVEDKVVPEGTVLRPEALAKMTVARKIGGSARTELRSGVLSDTMLVEIAKRIAERRGDE